MSETPVRVRLSRSALIVDRLRVARSLRAPELGPRLLFFSGGSALRPLSRVLKQYTHNSVHLITAFDSGGSSAQLRQAFAMPAIGDLRNRIVALADESVRGNPQIYKLFCYRLPSGEPPEALRRELHDLVSGAHPLVEDIPDPPMRQIVRTHLRFFLERMPQGFDLKGANIGNLMLAGGYLANARDLDSVLFLFSKLLEVRGTVHPIVDVDLHLCAELENAEQVVGQHRLTGKEVRPIESAVRNLHLVEGLDRPTPANVVIGDKIRMHLEAADLICLPMGSFYTSVIANLLPKGVGQAIAAANCPRVYIPNAGVDPEQRGMTLSTSLQRLVEYVRRDAGPNVPIDAVVNLVVVDRDSTHYSMNIDREQVEAMGVQLLACDLVSPESAPYADPVRLTEVLLSLI